MLPEPPTLRVCPLTQSVQPMKPMKMGTVLKQSPAIPLPVVPTEGMN